MQKLILQTLLLLSCAFMLQAQSNLSNQTLLSGKYEVNISLLENSHTLLLNSSTPGIFNAVVTMRLTMQDGTIRECNTGKKFGRGNTTLYTTDQEIQQVTITSFSLQYTEFGENYQLHWDTGTSNLVSTKDGVNNSYANAFILQNTSFQHADQPTVASKE